MSKKYFSGVSLPNDGLVLTSFHFTDDALFLGEWDSSNLRNLLKILKYFQLASGLRINWTKSTLAEVGVFQREKVISGDIVRI